MEYEAGDYQRLQLRQFPPRSLRETAEGKFWRRFQTPVNASQFGPVSHLDFCPVYPYHLAATSSTRVILYDGLTRNVNRTISRFKDTAYSGCFRADGKLLVAGSQDGVVQVFDPSSRGVLRQFKAHKRAVHVTRFSPDKLHVLSGSDDVTARWWDVSSGAQVCRLDGHTDYVRAAGVSPANMETWATGGYDHSVRLWDMRMRNSCVMTLDHGSPVEDLEFFPSGSLLVSAGGNCLNVWDIVGGGRLLRKLSNFQKTVTCVTLSPMAGPDSSASPRMLAGSLDGHLKIFELDNFTVTHASKYPSPILSLALSPDCSSLAVGLADGTLSIRKQVKRKPVTGLTAGSLNAHPDGRQPRRVRYGPKLTAANYKYFIRGQSEKAAAGDFRVVARIKSKLAPYDRLLRQFQYRGALDSALATGQPEIVISVVEELAARGGLNAALGGRDAAGLVPLLNHLAAHVTEPRYTRLLVNITNRVLDGYSEVIGQSPEVDAKLLALKSRISRELALHSALLQLQGCLEPILAASMAGLSLAGEE
ncbi:MAG: hypothetical protein WDW36_005346 [Sanguina aurantia]